MYEYWLLLPIVCPVAGALAAALIRTVKVRRLVLSAVLLLEILLLLPVMAGDVGTLQILELAGNLRLVLRADAVSKFFSMLIAAIWFFVALFAFEYMEHEHHRQRFFCFFLLTLATLIGVCFSANLVTLYLFYELMTLCTVPLVLHVGSQDAFEAAWKYLAFSVTGAGFALLGLFVLQRYCTTDLFTPGGVLDAAMAGDDRQLLLAVFLLMIIGFGCKAGMFPLHAWLPIAHPVAPGPASAVLSGLITKMGIVAIIRVVFFLYGWEFVIHTWAQTVVLILSLITVVVGSALALRQDGLKKRLAFSTVSQVSYVIFGLMLLNPVALQGALYQVLFHALAKNLLFLATAAIIYKSYLGQVSQLRGVGTVYPVTLWCFGLASLSLIGIPPTGGFVAKWELVQGALGSTEAGFLRYGGLAVLMLSALLTAVYLLPIVTNAFFPGRDFDDSVIHRQNKTPLMCAVLCILTAVSLILGMFPQLIAPAVDAIVNPLF